MELFYSQKQCSISIQVDSCNNFVYRIVVHDVLSEYVLPFQVTPDPDRVLIAEFKNIPMVIIPPRKYNGE